MVPSKSCPTTNPPYTLLPRYRIFSFFVGRGVWNANVRSCHLCLNFFIAKFFFFFFPLYFFVWLKYILPSKTLFSQGPHNSSLFPFRKKMCSNSSQWRRQQLSGWAPFKERGETGDCSSSRL